MSERLFTRNFVLVCVASLGHQTSFQLLLATMPLYVLQMGGRETEVGMLMGIVAAAALAVRPASGWAVETLGRKKTMLVGPATFEGFPGGGISRIGLTAGGIMHRQ
jgi:MFS family permease